MKSIPQFGLPVVDQVFNLASERGLDGDRLARERVEAERARKAAAEYEARMQRLFAECPGFIGADAPAGEGQKGNVVVEPAYAPEAMAWLKRRFHVNENLSLSTDTGLCIEVRTRVRKPPTPGAKRVAVTWAKPQQFELSLGV